MIIDCRKWGTDPEKLKQHQQRVFVDGVEIHLVFYVDTGAGFVRTYDVGDGKIHNWRDLPKPWKAEESGCGALFKTIYGVVELKPITD